MFGYIISDKDEINVEKHEIFSFNILRKTNLNIFVIENNDVKTNTWIRFINKELNVYSVA